MKPNKKLAFQKIGNDAVQACGPEGCNIADHRKQAKEQEKKQGGHSDD